MQHNTSSIWIAHVFIKMGWILVLRIRKTFKNPWDTVLTNICSGRDRSMVYPSESQLFTKLLAVMMQVCDKNLKLHTEIFTRNFRASAVWWYLALYLNRQGINNSYRFQRWLWYSLFYSHPGGEFSNCTIFTYFFPNEHNCMETSNFVISDLSLAE